MSEPTEVTQPAAEPTLEPTETPTVETAPEIPPAPETPAEATPTAEPTISEDEAPETDDPSNSAAALLAKLMDEHEGLRADLHDIAAAVTKFFQHLLAS